jgi:hypothetical protein
VGRTRVSKCSMPVDMEKVCDTERDRVDLLTTAESNVLGEKYGYDEVSS